MLHSVGSFMMYHFDWNFFFNQDVICCGDVSFRKPPGICLPFDNVGGIVLLTLFLVPGTSQNIENSATCYSQIQRGQGKFDGILKYDTSISINLIR